MSSQVASPAKASTVLQQSQPSAGGLPLRPEREIAFTAREGTWMSVDVSPDGRTILFDHLGDLYLLPIEGGTARRLLGGMAFDVQPRFSPDGRHIAFVSDRGGRSAVWTMALDGSGLRQISPDAVPATLDYRDPRWTPDGTGVVALLPTGDDGGTTITVFPVGGEAAPRRLVTPRRGESPGMRMFTDASFSPDGQSLFLSASRNAGTDVLGGSYHRFGRFAIARLDMRTNQVTEFRPREGGAFAPLVTQSGRSLIYATRDYARSETTLRLYDLASGADRLLTRPVQLDMQENAYFDTIPAYDLTDDDRTLVLSHSGKLWRVDVASGRQTEIPFEIDVRLELGALSRFDYQFDDAQVRVRSMASPAVSPDGGSIAFASVGAIWIASTADGAMRRLTAADHRAQEAAWSPDGSWIAYATWDPAAAQGDLWRMRADGSGRPIHLHSRRGPYRDLLFAPDGRAVLARAPNWPRDTAFANRLQLRPSEPAEQRQPILSIPVSGGLPRTVAAIDGDWMAHGTTRTAHVEAQGGFHFAGADARLHFRERFNLLSIALDGTGRREEAPSEMAGAPPGELILSPGGDRVIRSSAVFDYSSGVTLLEVSRGPDGKLRFANPRPLRELYDMGWSPDGRHFWGFEDMRFVRYDRAAFERDPENYRPFELELSLSVPAARPSGIVVLRGARIITMRGNEMIERGDVVVIGNRIAAVGATGSVAIPAGATIIDAAGRTILPGWVDIHAHEGNSMTEYSRPFRMAELAYGVTTIRDPSTNSWPIPAWEDIAAGLDIGPRAFSTGLAIQTLERAGDDYIASVLRRYAQGMRTETVKEYRSGGRALRQRFVKLARQHRLTPTNETLDGFWSNLSHVVDGYGGVEHTPGITPYYDDVIQLIARSGTVWTPTLAVAGPDRYPDEYLAHLTMEHDLNRDRRYQRFMPRIFQNEPRDIYRIRPLDRYMTPRAAVDAARVVAAGGRVGLGSHGNVPGIGVHFELWTLARGGMPLHDVLRVGTIFSAEAIGHGADFGSIEPGKLADLQILAHNPLDDIRNTDSIEMIMANGFLYDADTLDRIWPERRPLPRQWWQE